MIVKTAKINPREINSCEYEDQNKEKHVRNYKIRENKTLKIVQFSKIRENKTPRNTKFAIRENKTPRKLIPAKINPFKVDHFFQNENFPSSFSR